MPNPEESLPADAPLAERMRPRTLDEYLGQEHLTGAGMPLRVQMERDALPSMILWGPPGTGKTSLARLIARLTKQQYVPFSAVMGGIKEIKEVMTHAERSKQYGQRTMVFIDEIHRFNKSQQDAFLPFVERGDITLIGATTENPSFEVNAALLSRARVYRLRELPEETLVTLLRRALTDPRGLGNRSLDIDDGLLRLMARKAAGDARTAYGLLESLAAAVPEGGEVSAAVLEQVLTEKLPLYDKSGEEHFNIISALHKSVRSSDVDGALYWLARMLEGGEDRLYLARRLVRMAIEDIGLADPRAVEQAMACMQTVQFLGIPEGDLALGQLTVYLAVAAKSDASYAALNRVRGVVKEGGVYAVPMALRNAPTRYMKEWGYGKGYQHAHADYEGLTEMQCLPEELAGSTFYEPTERGVEARIKERVEALRRWKQERRSKPLAEE